MCSVWDTSATLHLQIKFLHRHWVRFCYKADIPVLNRYVRTIFQHIIHCQKLLIVFSNYKEWNTDKNDRLPEKNLDDYQDLPNAFDDYAPRSAALGW